MSHHAPPPPSEVFPAFESACGRPGCPHIFRYKGAKPFDAIAVLLKAHKPHCVGRDIGATHRCPIGWQPTTGMMEKFSGAGCAEETPALGLARLIDEGSEDSQEEHPEPKELSDDVVCADQPSWDVGWKSYGASTHELPAAEEDAEMASFLCESTSADPEPSLTQPRNHEEARHGDNEATMYDFVVPTEIQAAGWTTPLQRAQSTATTMWLGKKTSDTVMVSSYCELRNECAEPPHGGQVPRCEGQVLSDSGVEIAATKSSARRVAPASKAPSVETMMQGTTAESDTETYCSFRSTCAEKTKSQRGSEARHCDNQGIVTDFGFGETAFDSPNSAPYTMPAATTTQISGGKKTAHTVAERKATLENDVWTGLVEPKRVVCRGCGKTIRLDKRSCYYPGLWLKHRERCDRIKNGISLPHSVLSWTEVEDELLETKYDSRMARASKSVVCTRRGRKSYSKARA